MEDCFIWRSNASGTFTVKSAYHEARTLLDRSKISVAERNPIWLLAWKVQAFPTNLTPRAMVEVACRDSKFLFEASQSGSSNGSKYGWQCPEAGVFKAELNAIMEGLILAESQSYAYIVVESDSLIAIQEIDKEELHCLWFGTIANIRSLAPTVES
ncbi:hypothetical protein PTKIN_Ptkin01aG0390800 [Pterospermum kingtungense]